MVSANAMPFGLARNWWFELTILMFLLREGFGCSEYR
jgi:hypothetical protein